MSTHEFDEWVNQWVRGAHAAWKLHQAEFSPVQSAVKMQGSVIEGLREQNDTLAREVKRLGNEVRGLTVLRDKAAADAAMWEERAKQLTGERISMLDLLKEAEHIATKEYVHVSRVHSEHAALECERLGWTTLKASHWFPTDTNPFARIHKLRNPVMLTTPGSELQPDRERATEVKGKKEK